MKVRRTPWWYYLVALIIGLAGGSVRHGSWTWY